MNLLRVARVLAGFVAFFTAIQLVPMALAIGEHGPHQEAACGGFEWSLGIGAATALVLYLLGRKAPSEMFRRETIAVAGAAWFLASMLGALPFWCSGLLKDPVDALFESVSGLTTCGGTVLGSAGNAAPEEACNGLLLWRAMLQWVGGIGIVLLFVALLPAMGSAGKNLLLAESVGVSMEGSQPRIRSQARAVVLTYVTLTTACMLCLVGFGNMSWFEAVCHSFTCLATGGFSTRSSIAKFDSLGDEVVLTVFMYLGGCSFTVMAGIAREGKAGLLAMLRSGEFRLYTLITAVAIGAVSLDLWRGGAGLGTAVRQSSFNVVSMLSCCGYATSDFHAWPPLSLIVIFTCMMIGGCSGSAAGGMKQVRLLICIKLLAYQIRTFVRPKVVERIQLDEETLAASTMSSVLAMVLLWLCTVLLGGMVIAFDQRVAFMGALSTSASMLANVGPGLAMVHPDALADGIPPLGAAIQAQHIVGPNIGPLGGFGELHGATKLAMCFEMVLGRLELLPLLALFSPAYWRR